MVLVFPDTALVYLLQQIVLPGVTYNLFDNDVRPSTDTTLASLHRATWSGYAPISLAGSAWSFAAVDAHVGELSALDIFWLNTSIATVTVYGYYIVDNTGTVLMGAARFDNAPLSIPVGKYVQVSPRLGSFSGLPS